MSLYSQNKGFHTPGSTAVGVVADINQIFKNQGNAIKDPEAANGLIIATEEFGDASHFRSTQTKMDSLIDQFKSSSTLMDFVTTRAGTGKDAQGRIQAALEEGAAVMLAYGNGESVIKALRKPGLVGDNVIPVMHSGDSTVDFALESFDPLTFEKFIPVIATLSMMSMLAGEFVETWFPQYSIPVGQDGYTYELSIPQIVTADARLIGGAASTVIRTDITKAMLDPTILDKSGTRVVPNASEASAASLLAPTGDVPTYTINIGGVDVPTRPIKMGTLVPDIISLGSHPGIIKNGVYDNWDQLDKIMNIGEVFFRVTVKNGATTKTAIFKNDVSMQQNALLSQKTMGLTQEYAANCNATLIINSDSVPVSGHPISEINTVLEGIFGTAGGVKNTLVTHTRLSAEGNIDRASFVVNANNTVVSNVINAASGELDLAVVDGTTLAITVVPLYYLPQVRRTNSNLRDYGVLIDANVSHRFRYPVTCQSPLATKTPLMGIASVNIETLVNIGNIMIKGQCFKKLLDTEEVLKSGNGLPAHSPYAGAYLVSPTYLYQEINADDITLTMNSVDAVTNLQAAIGVAVSVMGGQLLQKSNYIAGLMSMGLPADDYEFIILTDPRISGLMMTSGDMRYMGNNRAFQIAADPMIAVKNTIWMSIRRKNRNGNEPHCLDFGTRLTAPAIPIEVPMPRNGAITTETQVMIRSNAYVMLPILARIDLVGLDTIFTI
jgi:hypothetical protein